MKMAANQRIVKYSISYGPNYSVRVIYSFAKLVDHFIRDVSQDDPNRLQKRIDSKKSF